MRRIVVGVDASPGSVDALEWAAGVAVETGAEIEAVEAWELSYAWIDAGYWPDVERWTEESRRAAECRLDEAVAAVRARYPDVRMVSTLVEGQPAQVLTDLAKDADMLVVGSRGRGGFAGLLLGSVGQQCVHHSPVPVVVVPARS